MKKYIIVIVGILMLAMNASASFPVDEAGIAAYVSIGSSADLNETYAAYEDVLNTSKTHIIGTIRISNYAATNYAADTVPLVYVGADGWVVAYYPKAEPASKIMQWKNYNRPYINTTTLADAISKMATALGVNYETIKGNIKYYDFRYPDANLMTVIVEEVSTCWVCYGANSFNLTIPNDFIIYNVSFSHRVDRQNSKIIVNSDAVSDSNNGISYGYITQYFYKDIPIRVKIESYSDSGASIILIYRNF